MLTWGSIILIVLQVVNKILDNVKDDKAFQAGYGKAIAEQNAKMLASSKYAKRHLTERKRFYKEARYPFTVEKVKY